MERIFWFWFRRLLCKVFHFDKWHLSLLEERKYALDIIDYCNRRLGRHAIAEIGCGLGDIIRNVDFRKKRAFDAETSVLKAAAFLSRFWCRGKIRFRRFLFPQDQLSGRFDVILLVNWIHNIEHQVLRTGIQKYFTENLRPGGEIILDIVRNKAYKFNHDIFQMTSEIPCQREKIGEYTMGREIWAIRRVG